jgi:hypothetical protein
MFANWQQTGSLWFRERTGLTANFLILSCIAVIAALVTFIFLCVSGYAWAAVEFGPVFGGLATAGVFLTIAACCWAAATLSRARARQVLKSHGPRNMGARSSRAGAGMPPRRGRFRGGAGKTSCGGPTSASEKTASWR